MISRLAFSVEFVNVFPSDITPAYAESEYCTTYYTKSEERDDAVNKEQLTKRNGSPKLL